MNLNRPLPTLLTVACLLTAVSATGMTRGLRGLPKMAQRFARMALNIPSSAIYNSPVTTCPNDERKHAFTTMAIKAPITTLSKDEIRVLASASSKDSLLNALRQHPELNRYVEKKETKEPLLFPVLPDTAPSITEEIVLKIEALFHEEANYRNFITYAAAMEALVKAICTLNDQSVLKTSSGSKLAIYQPETNTMPIKYKCLVKAGWGIMDALVFLKRSAEQLRLSGTATAEQLQSYTKAIQKLEDVLQLKID